MTRREDTFHMFDTSNTPLFTLTRGPKDNPLIAAVVTCSKGGVVLSEGALYNLKIVIDDLLGEGPS